MDRNKKMKNYTDKDIIARCSNKKVPAPRQF